MENERRVQQKTPAGRYALLDELRGLDLVSMMLYHACWDMMFLFGIWMDWYIGWPGRLWQQSICWVFILLSGFCVPLGHRTLKRGAQVFAAGCMVRELLYSVFRLSALRFLFHRLFCPAAVAVFVLGRVLPAFLHGAAAHGALAPLGLPGAGLDGPALAFAVSAAPAGDLRRTFGRGSSFCIKGLTQPGSCGILSVVRRY